MHFFNTNKDYVNNASHFQPIYSLDVDTAPPRTMKFTGYKSPRCVLDFERLEIPFDGSHWMFRIDDDWDGSDVLNELLEVWLDSLVVIDGGLDPRARVSTTWRVAHGDVVSKVLNTAHIYGASDRVTISQIVMVERGDTSC